jgi:hypothetical protein
MATISLSRNNGETFLFYYINFIKAVGLWLHVWLNNFQTSMSIFMKLCMSVIPREVTPPFWMFQFISINNTKRTASQTSGAGMTQALLLSHCVEGDFEMLYGNLSFAKVILLMVATNRYLNFANYPTEPDM